MKRTALLRESLPAICRAVTRQKGIKLVFQGPPRTDGTTIYSNPLPIDADADQVKMIVGDIDHECGHILFTDFDYHRSRIEQETPERRPLLQALANAIEDTMVERRTGAEYLGCRTTLAESAELLEASIEEFTVPDDPGKCLANFIDCWGRVNVLDQQVEKSLDATQEAVETQLGSKGLRKLEALLSQHLFSVDSTEATWGLVKRVEQFLDSLEDEEDDEDEQDQEGSDDASDQEQSPEGQAPSSGESDSEAPASGDGQETGQEAANDGNEAYGQGPGKSHPGAQEILVSNPDPTPLFDRREQADEAIEEASRNHYVPEGPDGGLDEVDQGGQGGSLRITPVPGAYATVKAAVDGQVQQLARRIVQEYQTRTRRRWVSSEEGRLDGRRLVQAHMGNPRVYRRRQQQTIPFPAVGLVVDGSSSMRGREMELALQASAVLAETNQVLNVRTGIHVFAGDQVEQIKGYDQPLVQVKEYLAGVQASGGTPMADALWAAGCALARQREKRKLLFLITDGAPNDAQATIEIADMLQRSQIEIYGVGIGSHAVERFCNHAAVVNDATDVAGAILSALRASITRAA